MRLQKYLSLCGVASRRESEKFIISGRVRVNGHVAEIGGDFEKGDVVTLDGKRISPFGFIYIALNKPEGYITSVRDQFGRKTVLDLIRKEHSFPNIYPVGRLDYDSSGLIIITNDGEFANALLRPANGVKKRYISEISGVPSPEDLARFRNGLIIDGRKTAPCEVKISKRKKDGCLLNIVLQEGRNRQIRKMCAAIGQKIKSLKRVSIGELKLGKLPRGEYRVLSKHEIINLFEKIHKF